MFHNILTIGNGEKNKIRIEIFEILQKKKKREEGINMGNKESCT